jgi:hypothetical protein
MRRVRMLRRIWRCQEMLSNVYKGQGVNSGPKFGDIVVASKVGLVVSASGATAKILGRAAPRSDHPPHGEDERC